MTERSAGPVGPLEVDGVILAVPAIEAAGLLAGHAPVASEMLGAIRYSSVAVVTLSLPAGTVGAPLVGTGFLVPRTSDVDGRPALITGCTYLSRKWPHLARPGDELLRVSVGRFGDERHLRLGDDELVGAVLAELATLLDVRDEPLDALVTRWDRAFPQYEVGHLLRVGRIEQSLDTVPGVAVAGAALRGVGIPACIASGRSAARRVLASWEAPRPGPPLRPGAAIRPSTPWWNRPRPQQRSVTRTRTREPRAAPPRPSGLPCPTGPRPRGRARSPGGARRESP